jgi:hypothetical protein
MNSKPSIERFDGDKADLGARPDVCCPMHSSKPWKWVGLERRSLIGKESAPYSQPRELMRGFPQADLNEAASAADAFACLLHGGRGDLS